MGLTNRAVGRSARRENASIRPQKSVDCTVALAGNPNVGKSTVFNALTGMHQHTGNWPGKTVTRAQGYFCTKERNYSLVDLPGTYSLVPHSPEEEVADRFLCFGDADAVVVVCDATCPERNLHLALQILECGRPTVLCFNLMDEAKRKGIHIDLPHLQKRLGIPVLGVVARKKKTLKDLKQVLDGEISHPSLPHASPLRYPY
ncbi:MAG: 50S ribosome-binding GTPase, partial [Clostridia bacterium]|nr:50S ribosome-binding GTPase [Clostridia bacterium]